jgi:trk system potassium uptake protein
MFGFGQTKPEYAVIGLGRFGSSVALSLAERGHSVLGIDRDPATVQAYADRLTNAIVLDSTNEDALRSVDITSFRTVVVAIGINFEANLLTTTILKELGIPTIICKALSERQKTILERLGASRVILPEHEAGIRLARDLNAPWLSDRIVLDQEHSVTQVSVPGSLIGRSYAECDLRQRFGVVVLTVTRGKQLAVLPAPDFVFAANDELVVIGENSAIALMLESSHP